MSGHHPLGQGEAGDDDEEQITAQLTRIRSNQIVPETPTTKHRPYKRSSRSWITPKKQTDAEKREAAILKIQGQLQGKKTSWLIDPRDRWVRVWDVVTGLALLFTAIVTPYELGFLPTSFNTLFWINRVVDVVFIIDIFLQFFMIYYDEADDIWVQDHARITVTYLKSWFIVDAVSVVPFDLVGLLINDGSVTKLKVIRIIKLLRIAKLLRVLRVGRIFQRAEETLNINYKTLQLYTFAGMVGFCAHWMACALQLCIVVNDCTVSDYYDGECTNWVYYYNGNGGNGQLLPVGEDGNFMVVVPEGATEDGVTVEDPLDYLPAMNLFTVYWAAVYWAVMTMSTIGYGDVTPQTDSERIYVVIGMCLGASIYAYLVGNVCNIIASMAAGQEAFRQEMDNLNIFLVENSVPNKLSARLRDFYRYRHSNVTVHGSMTILNTLCPELRMEVADYTDVYWLSKSDLFLGFPKAMVVNMCLSIVPEVYVPGEIIFQEGTVCDRLYICERGVVYSRGRFFGRPSAREKPVSVDDHMPVDKQDRSMIATIHASKFCDTVDIEPNTAARQLTTRPRWIGLVDMSSTKGLHRHFAVSFTHSVMFTIRRDDLEAQLSKFPRVKHAFRTRSVRQITRELILLYARALAFIMKQTEDSLIGVLFMNRRLPTENWILKHKFAEVLDLAQMKLGPDSPLSVLIRSARRAAVIIQAAYRGMVSRRRFLAELEYNDFLTKKKMGVSGEAETKDGGIIKARRMGRAAGHLAMLHSSIRSGYTAPEDTGHEATLATTLQLKKELDEGKMMREDVLSSSSPSRVLGEIRDRSRKSSLREDQADPAPSSQSSPSTPDLSTRSPPSSQRNTLSSMPRSGSVEKMQQDIVNQVSKNVRKCLANIADDLHAELDEIKRTMRDIATNRSGKTYT